MPRKRRTVNPYLQSAQLSCGPNFSTFFHPRPTLPEPFLYSRPNFPQPFAHPYPDFPMHFPRPYPTFPRPPLPHPSFPRPLHPYVPGPLLTPHQHFYQASQHPFTNPMPWAPHAIPRSHSIPHEQHIATDEPRPTPAPALPQEPFHLPEPELSPSREQTENIPYPIHETVNYIPDPKPAPQQSLHDQFLSTAIEEAADQATGKNVAANGERNPEGHEKEKASIPAPKQRTRGQEKRIALNNGLGKKGRRNKKAPPSDDSKEKECVEEETDVESRKMLKEAYASCNNDEEEVEYLKSHGVLLSNGFVPLGKLRDVNSKARQWAKQLGIDSD